MTGTFKFKKPEDVGLAVRRFVVFALPVIVLIGAFGGTAIMSMFKPKPEEKDEIVKATPVVIAEAMTQKAQLVVTAQGEASPRTEIDLTPQVSGNIVFVSPAFIEGGAFEKDDVLIRIEPDEYAFRVTQAKANVAQARSRYASEETEANIARAEWEEIGGGEEGSALALRKPQLAEAAAALSAAKAALKEAELQLARTTIRAPFKGRVQTRTADFGQYVTPGVALGRIFSSDTIEVALPLTDAELGQLGLPIGFKAAEDQAGPQVKLSATVAGAPREWTGEITRTDNSYDRQTRVIFAYAEVKDPYGEGADDGAPLAAGLFVTAEIEGREIEGSVVVPRSALRGENQVYIARDDNTLEIRPVVVAQTDRTRAVLISGVSEGERVITSPVRGAANGIEIEVAGDPDDEDGASSVADASDVGGIR